MLGESTASCSVEEEEEVKEIRYSSTSPSAGVQEVFNESSLPPFSSFSSVTGAGTAET